MTTDLIEPTGLCDGGQRVRASGAHALVERVVVLSWHQHLTDHDRLALAVGQVRIREASESPMASPSCSAVFGPTAISRGPDGMRPRTTVNDGAPCSAPIATPVMRSPLASHLGEGR